MANALACLPGWASPTSAPRLPAACTPSSSDFAARAKVISIAEPGHTDALEFDDGKLMLGKYQSLGDVSWDNLVARVGRDELQTADRRGAP